MGGHGIAEAIPANYQPLIGQAANNACQPLVMRETKDDGSGEQRKEIYSCHWQRGKFFSDQISVQERTIKHFFDRRDDQGRTDDANYREDPTQSRIFPEIAKGIPRCCFYKRLHLAVVWIES